MSKTTIAPAAQQAWDKAVNDGGVSDITALIKAGVGCDSYSQGEPAICLATLYGHPGVVRALIEAGANVNAKNSMGFTPLHTAISRQNNDIMNALLDAGARTDFAPRQHTRDYLTPFQLLVRTGRIEDVRDWVLNRGENIDQITFRRQTLAQLAEKHPDMVAALRQLREELAASEADHDEEEPVRRSRFTGMRMG